MLITIFKMLHVLELLVILIMGAFAFSKGETLRVLYGLFFTELGIVAIRIVQIPLCLMLERSCVNSIILVVVWGLHASKCYREIQKEKSKK